MQYVVTIDKSLTATGYLTVQSDKDAKDVFEET